ncbi:MAG: tetratricopeptide repeat protein [bacterium]|nr:tetratricopeptide repeat protein [bacterium]
MADLKEETSVENTNPVEETVEQKKKPIDPTLEGIQLFYEKNKKLVNYVGGGLVVLIAVLVYFKLYYLPEQENEAANEMFWAESYFEKDSFALALRGGVMVMTADGQKPMLGFEQVADQYGMTKTGNLANYYAGVCYLRIGKFEQAIECLGKYDGKDEMIAPIAIGAIGDCHMELKRTDEALKYYLKASEKSHNGFTTPYFLKKAAFANEVKSNYTEALELYERIGKEFPKSSEAREIDREIARVKTLSGQ